MPSEHSHHDHHGEPSGSFWASRAFLVFCGFAAIAVVLLWKEHQAHILGIIPWLFLLACPLMHAFMHGGHGGHNHSGDSSAGRKSNERDGGNA